MDYFEGTKGEWISDGTVVSSQDKNEEIADVWAANGLPHGEWTTDDKLEARANARLISASPDLLDVAIYSWMLLNDIPEEFMDDFIKKTVNKLESSISKALGYKIGNK